MKNFRRPSLAASVDNNSVDDRFNESIDDLYSDTVPNRLLNRSSSFRNPKKQSNNEVVKQPNLFRRRFSLGGAPTDVGTTTFATPSSTTQQQHDNNRPPDNNDSKNTKGNNPDDMRQSYHSHKSSKNDDDSSIVFSSYHTRKSNRQRAGSDDDSYISGAGQFSVAASEDMYSYSLVDLDNVSEVGDDDNDLENYLENSGLKEYKSHYLEEKQIIEKSNHIQRQQKRISNHTKPTIHNVNQSQTYEDEQQHDTKRVGHQVNSNQQEHDKNNYDYENDYSNNNDEHDDDTVPMSPMKPKNKPFQNERMDSIDFVDIFDTPTNRLLSSSDLPSFSTVSDENNSMNRHDRVSRRNVRAGSSDTIDTNEYNIDTSNEYSKMELSTDLLDHDCDNFSKSYFISTRNLEPNNKENLLNNTIYEEPSEATDRSDNDDNDNAIMLSANNNVRKAIENTIINNTNNSVIDVVKVNHQKEEDATTILNHVNQQSANVETFNNSVDNKNMEYFMIKPGSYVKNITETPNPYSRENMEYLMMNHDSSVKNNKESSNLYNRENVEYLMRPDSGVKYTQENSNSYNRENLMKPNNDKNTESSNSYNRENEDYLMKPIVPLGISDQNINNNIQNIDTSIPLSGRSSDDIIRNFFDLDNDDDNDNGIENIDTIALLGRNTDDYDDNDDIMMDMYPVNDSNVTTTEASNLTPDERRERNKLAYQEGIWRRTASLNKKYGDNDSIMSSTNRNIAFAIVVVAAIVVTLLAYILLSVSNNDNENATAQYNDYQTIEFQQAATSALTVVQFKLQMLRQSMRSLSYQITLYSSLTESIWPNVTVNNFDTQVSQFVTTIAEYPVVMFTPYIMRHQRNPWQAYAINIYENVTEPPIQLRYDSIWGSVPGSELYIPFPPDAEGPFHPIHQIYEGFIGAHGVGSQILYDMMTSIGYKEFYVDSVKRYNRGFISRTLPLDVYREAYRNVGPQEPLSLVMEPIFNSTNSTTLAQDPSTTFYQKNNLSQVGAVASVFQWRALFYSIMKEGQTPIYCQVTNTCGDDFAFSVNGQNVAYLGPGDPEYMQQYSDVKITVSLDDPFYAPPPRNITSSGYCSYTLNIYPGMNSQLSSDTSTEPVLLYAGVVGTVFLLLIFGVLLYFELSRRNNQIKYTKLNAMNAPTMLLAFDNTHTPVRDDTNDENVLGNIGVSDKYCINDQGDIAPNSFTNLDETSSITDSKKRVSIDYLQPDKFKKMSNPSVADLYPNTTILVADLTGFTPWASEREPSQVFIMLETIFRSFDLIAKKRKILKIDAVGDSYVAAAGLEEHTSPNKEMHAVSMARFGCEILLKTTELMQKLEILLGPGTTDLCLRVGLHSGPVYRNSLKRFQLFGDTVHIASRMESNGIYGRVQCTKETADLLFAAGVGHWIQQRDEMMQLRGKGMVQTFFVEADLESNKGSSVASEQVSEGESAYRYESAFIDDLLENISIRSSQTKRLIDWNVDVLVNLIKQIIAHREADTSRFNSTSSFHWEGSSYRFEQAPLMELKGVIEIPKFDLKRSRRIESTDEVLLTDEVMEQLNDFVTNVALYYNDNPFHNFEHASHMVLSVKKLLSRLPHPEEIMESCDSKVDEDYYRAQLNNHTDGIASDPLTQFACVFSALIHDSDHAGVPNTQLVREGHEIVNYYNRKSVAEQNSIDLCWDLLMKEKYSDLRRAICSCDSELIRFRQLVVNSVLATDLVDFDLKKQRKRRWKMTFDSPDYDHSSRSSLSADLDGTVDYDVMMNRKATLVIETIIQASDIAHAMQHWNVYRKWNERYFAECYQAYCYGRAEHVPSVTWYVNELEFFDFYVIPIATKLKECNVCSSDECLQYALMNRKEWELRGQDIVKEMLENNLNTLSEDRNASSEDSSEGKRKDDESANGISRTRSEDEDLIAISDEDEEEDDDDDDDDNDDDDDDDDAEYQIDENDEGHESDKNSNLESGSKESRLRNGSHTGMDNQADSSVAMQSAATASISAESIVMSLPSARQRRYSASCMSRDEIPIGRNPRQRRNSTSYMSRDVIPVGQNAAMSIPVSSSSTARPTLHRRHSASESEISASSRIIFGTETRVNL